MSIRFFQFVVALLTALFVLGCKPSDIRDCETTVANINGEEVCCPLESSGIDTCCPFNDANEDGVLTVGEDFCLDGSEFDQESVDINLQDYPNYIGKSLKDGIKVEFKKGCELGDYSCNSTVDTSAFSGTEIYGNGLDTIIAGLILGPLGYVHDVSMLSGMTISGPGARVDSIQAIGILISEPEATITNSIVGQIEIEGGMLVTGYEKQHIQIIGNTLYGYANSGPVIVHENQYDFVWVNNIAYQGLSPSNSSSGGFMGTFAGNMYYNVLAEPGSDDNYDGDSLLGFTDPNDWSATDNWIVEDPGFVNWTPDPGQGDFHLQPTSPAVNAGEFVEGIAVLVDDIDSDPRDDQMPDVGADEVQ